MSWLDSLFKRPKTTEIKYAQAQTGDVPVYASLGRDVFASDAVQSAIQCITSEMKKLQPQHTRKGAGDKDTVSIYASEIQRALDNPNPLMTTSEFIEKVIWALYLKDNSFVIPTCSTNGTLNGLYPINPSQVDFEEGAAGALNIRFRFPNGLVTVLPYDNVIHVRKKFSLNDFMGGDASGQPDNDTLRETLALNKTLLEGIAKTMNSAGQVNGVVKYNTMLDNNKMKVNAEGFNKLLQQNESGFLFLDLKSEFQPIKRDIHFVDPETVKFIDEKILRFYGVPLPILTGDYTPAQFEAFYDKTLEPLIISLSQAFTKALFTDGERAHGNRIVFQPGAMVFMTTSEKLEMARILGDRGSLYENELRIAFGLTPISDLEGVRMQSLNYVNSAIAEDYQLQAPVPSGTTE